MLTSSTKVQTLPITVAELKDHLRVDDTNEDSYIESLAWAAVNFIEQETGKDFLDTTWVDKLSEFPGYDDPIEIVKQPVIGVTSITYYDGDNTSQTLATNTYHVMIPVWGMTFIQPVYDQSWPETYTRPDAVTITYTTGWTTCPDLFKHCVRLIVAEWYELRTSDVTGTIVSPISLGAQRLLDLLSVWVVR